MENQFDVEAMPAEESSLSQALELGADRQHSAIFESTDEKIIDSAHQPQCDELDVGRNKSCHENTCQPTSETVDKDFQSSEKSQVAINTAEYCRRIIREGDNRKGQPIASRKSENEENPFPVVKRCKSNYSPISFSPFRGNCRSSVEDKIGGRHKNWNSNFRGSPANNMNFSRLNTNLFRKQFRNSQGVVGCVPPFRDQMASRNFSNNDVWHVSGIPREIAASSNRELDPHESFTSNSANWYNNSYHQRMPSRFTPANSSFKPKQESNRNPYHPSTGCSNNSNFDTFCPEKQSPEDFMLTSAAHTTNYPGYFMNENQNFSQPPYNDYRGISSYSLSQFQDFHGFEPSQSAYGRNSSGTTMMTGVGIKQDQESQRSHSMKASKRDINDRAFGEQQDMNSSRFPLARDMDFSAVVEDNLQDESRRNTQQTVEELVAVPSNENAEAGFDARSPAQEALDEKRRKRAEKRKRARAAKARKKAAKRQRKAEKRLKAKRKEEAREKEQAERTAMSEGTVLREEVVKSGKAATIETNVKSEEIVSSQKLVRNVEVMENEDDLRSNETSESEEVEIKL